MEGPIVAQKKPFAVDVEGGEEYWWCSCGRSQSQPFCDGSHKGTGLSPMQYVAGTSETMYFCGCKHTAEKPLCDGSHKTL